MTRESTPRLHEVVQNAIHESVTAETLTSTGTRVTPELNNGSLFSRVREDEQPHFVFKSKKHTPETYGPGAPDEVTRSRRHRVYHLVTDQRWAIIAGNTDGDQVRSIPLDEIEAINYDTEGRFNNRLSKGLSNNTVVLEVKDGFVKFAVSNDYETADFERLTEYLRRAANVEPEGVALDSDDAGYTIDGIEQHEPDQETVKTLLDAVPSEASEEADALVAESTDAQELVRGLNELIQDYEEGDQSLDDRVADSSSADELRESVRSPVERAVDDAKYRTDHVIRNSDPEEVSRWATSSVSAAGPIAFAAPWSTPLLLTGTLLAGGAAGAYASSSESTPLDSVDPEELARHARAMARQGEDLEHIDGAAVGAILGSSRYLSQQMLPEEYARWIVEADPEAILYGAEQGARAAQNEQIGVGRRSGSLVGASVGWTVGHHPEYNDSEDVFQELLGDELYDEYREKLSERGIDISE